MTSLFFMTGNGDFNTPVSTYGDYGDSFLKVTPDTSSAANPNIDGYGLHVSDYFTPDNQLDLSNADKTLAPAVSCCCPLNPVLFRIEIVGSGKQRLIYVVNRDNMGQYSSTTNNVIQTVNLGNGTFSSPAYFNGAITIMLKATC